MPTSAESSRLPADVRRAVRIVADEDRAEAGRDRHARPSALMRAPQVVLDVPRGTRCRRGASRPSVEEVPLAGEHHREPELVGASRSPHRRACAAGLDDRGHARPPRRLRRRRGTDRTRRSRRAALRPGPPPCFAAISPDSTRFCWPAPMPTAWPSLTSTIAFDFTCPQMRHASSRSRHCSAVGATLVTTRHVVAAAAKWCGCLHEETAGDLAEVERLASGRGRFEDPRVPALRLQRVDRRRRS